MRLILDACACARSVEPALMVISVLPLRPAAAYSDLLACVITGIPVRSLDCFLCTLRLDLGQLSNF